MTIISDIAKLANTALGMIAAATEGSPAVRMVLIFMLINAACFAAVLWLWYLWFRSKRSAIPKKDVDQEHDSLVVLIRENESAFKVQYYGGHNGDRNNMSLTGYDHDRILSTEFEESRESERIPVSDFMPVLHELEKNPVDSDHAEFHVADMRSAECGDQWKVRLEREGIYHAWIIQVKLRAEQHTGWLIIGWAAHQSDRDPLIVGGQCALAVDQGHRSTLYRAALLAARSQVVMDRYLKRGFTGILKRAASHILHKM